MTQRFWKWLRDYAAKHVEPEPIRIYRDGDELRATSGNRSIAIVNGRTNTITGTTFRTNQ